MVGLRRTDTDWDYDVLIVGGSLVGLTLAAWLGQSGLRVLVIEAQTGMAGAPARVYALMPLTQMIWESLGVWAQISPRIQTYDQIDLSDLGRNSVTFTPADLAGKQALGHVAEHGQIWPVFRDFVAQIPSVSYWEATQWVDLSIAKTGVTVTLQSHNPIHNPIHNETNPEIHHKTRQITVGLLVGADGANSPVRQRLGMGTWGWRYGQSCLTTVIQADYAPIAYERFWAAGPLAVLPLPNQRWGIVWTLPHAQATRYVDLPAADFLAKLAPHLPFQDVTLAGERRCFPVGWRQARRYVGYRLALVGDAAHGCHPVGGQGLNLGVRDAATLGEILASAHQRGEDVGASNILHLYQRWRWPENLLTLLFTDSLNRVFSQGWWPLVPIRAWGLRVLQRVGGLRRLSLSFMAGLWGRLPGNL